MKWDKEMYEARADEFWKQIVEKNKQISQLNKKIKELEERILKIDASQENATRM